MSHINDTLTKCKSAIAANATYTSANIWKRKELELDHVVGAIDVFMDPMSAVFTDPAMVSDFRVYRIKFVVVFDVDGRANATSATDTVTTNKSDYFDSLATAIRTTMPGQSYAISNIYHCRFVEGNLNEGEDVPQYDEVGPTTYRISQTWEFSSYES